MSVPEFTITRTFDAPRETLWRAWTDPTLAARWWHPHEVTTPAESVSIDLRVGGSYAYLMIDPDGGEWPATGEYLEVREPDRLRFTWVSPDDERGDEVPVITVDLAEAGEGRTLMTFHMARHPDDRGSEHGVYDGWTEAFEELDEVLATSRTR
ncbi:MAG: SRPBCC domain-containing protein [Dietzia sp.]|uniref:SRPBCC family protein n=1 Tax=Dietzia sp. TaxID=1871616 RepID=UPI0027174CEA|nr:SRPBCC domain-containing protein [Dietzia sp.]MDO8394219.1 SRPBCC domain-containing protein [Dietzia sp.]